MIKNKKFIDLTSGKVFEVIDQFEDIAILDNKVKVKVNKLLDKSYYDEYIDPNSFFRNDKLVNAFTEKIRQLPLDNIQNKDKYDDMLNESLQVEGSVNAPFSPRFSEPAVLPYDPEEEKRELMKKARKMFESDQKDIRMQNSGLENFMKDSDDNFSFNDNQLADNAKMSETEPAKIIHREPENYMSQSTQNGQSVDPIISMFRNVKRNTDFSLTFSLNHKIPRLDFIEMMEDSYNTSLIDFLSEEFTNLILLNPSVIKNKISEEIRKLVYGDNEEETEVKKPIRKNKKEND